MDDHGEKCKCGAVRCAKTREGQQKKRWVSREIAHRRHIRCLSAPMFNPYFCACYYHLASKSPLHACVLYRDEIWSGRLFIYLFLSEISHLACSIYSIACLLLFSPKSQISRSGSRSVRQNLRTRKTTQVGREAVSVASWGVGQISSRIPDLALVKDQAKQLLFTVCMLVLERTGIIVHIPSSSMNTCVHIILSTVPSRPICAGKSMSSTLLPPLKCRILHACQTRHIAPPLKAQTIKNDDTAPPPPAALPSARAMLCLVSALPTRRASQQISSAVVEIRLGKLSTRACCVKNRGCQQNGALLNDSEICTKATILLFQLFPSSPLHLFPPPRSSIPSSMILWRKLVAAASRR